MEHGDELFIITDGGFGRSAIITAVTDNPH